MKMSVLLLVSLMSIASTASYAQEKEAESEGPRGVGEGKAITEANHNDGIKVSDIAIKRLGIVKSAVAVGPNGTVKVPSQSVLFYQDGVGIYRYRSGWFKRVEGKVVIKDSVNITFSSKDLKSGDEVVTKGAVFLHLGELNIWSSGGDAE